MKKCQFSWIGSFLHNKRDLRADGLPLQPSALRPRLLSRTGKPINYTAFLGFFIPNRGRKLSNVAKIVVMTTILSVFGLFSINFTTPVSAASLTLSVPTDTLKLGLQPNNTFAKSSSGSVSVKTDALGGYILSIKAKSSNELVNGSNKIASITGNLTEDQYKASGNTNTWGYQPSKFNSLNNSAFLPGPTTSLSTIEATKAKNDTANNYNFVIGSKVDNTIPKGIYSNTFVFTATANTVSYSITYNLNSGTWNGKSPQTGNTVESTITLDSNRPSRTNYEFKGWCPQETHDETCGTTSYQPSNSYPLNNNDNNVTLWAMWAFGSNTLQGWNGCSSLSTSSSTTLLDIRDGSSYTVTKLKDNKCWMTQNLRITGSSSFQSGFSKTLNSKDSDLPGGTTYTLPNSATWTDSSSNANSNHAYYANNTNYGAYYTWYTATAGTGTSSITSNGKNATGSICPKGWRLPTGGSNGEFQSLITIYNISNSSTGSATLRSDPLNFSLPGYVSFNNGTLQYPGDGGVYWSSTVESSTKAYSLGINNSTVKSTQSDSRPIGVSVRCIKK